MIEGALQRISGTIRSHWDELYSDDLTVERIKEILNPLEEDLILVVPEVQQRDDDYRLGNDVYGYENDESIILNMQYIADRWNVAMRIVWMLGIINPDYR